MSHFGRGVVMSARASGLKRTETARLLGARVVFADTADIVAAAGQGRLELLTGARYPSPVQTVRFWLEPGFADDVAVVRLAADIRTSGLPPARVIVDAAALVAAGPVGMQLARALRGVLARSDGAGGAGGAGGAAGPALLSRTMISRQGSSCRPRSRMRAPPAAVTGWWAAEGRALERCRSGPTCSTPRSRPPTCARWPC